jgi:hypothetical protein
VYWWLNRTPSGYRRDPDAELPLFSVSLPDARRTPSRSSTPTAAAPAVPKSREAAPVAAAPVKAAPISAAPISAAPVAAPVAKAAAPAAPVEPTAVPAPPPPAPQSAKKSSSPPNIIEISTATPKPSSTDSVAQPLLAHGVPGSFVEGHMLRFSVPQEGTLQFLPGRLEVAGGLDAGREIRFVRVPGPDGTEVTFGRSEGPAYRHIQLREATVSRLHARLTLREGTWHLTNLSATNPAVYNGRMLDSGEEQPLSDGDRIEMGEVLFGFRSR